jgi:hypothetical protein
VSAKLLVLLFADFNQENQDDKYEEKIVTTKSVQ